MTPEERAAALRDSWKAVLANVDKLQEIRQERRAAQEAHDKAKAMLKPFHAPKRVEDIEEYIQFMINRGEAQIAVEEAARILKQIEEAQREVEKTIVHAMPQEVWFKYGDIGFGVAFSDWGGSHWDVVIAPWQEKMPNLDRRHRGD